MDLINGNIFTLSCKTLQFSFALQSRTENPQLTNFKNIRIQHLFYHIVQVDVSLFKMNPDHFYVHKLEINLANPYI